MYFFDRVLAVKEVPGDNGRPPKEETRELFVRNVWPNKGGGPGKRCVAFGREHQDGSDRLVPCDRVVYLS